MSMLTLTFILVATGAFSTDVLFYNNRSSKTDFVYVVGFPHMSDYIKLLFSSWRRGLSILFWLGMDPVIVVFNYQIIKFQCCA